MNSLKSIKLLGETSIFSSSNQFTVTSSYSSSDWEILTKSWQITMYLTFPLSGESVEQPSVTFNPSTQIQVPRKKTWDEAIGEVLDKRSELWERLADL
jgi:hypothetical protein